MLIICQYPATVSNCHTYPPNISRAKTDCGAKGRFKTEAIDMLITPIFCSTICKYPSLWENYQYSCQKSTIKLGGGTHKPARITVYYYVQIFYRLQSNRGWCQLSHEHGTLVHDFCRGRMGGKGSEREGEGVVDSERKGQG